VTETPVTVSRWQRSLLPAMLLDEAGVTGDTSRGVPARSARDWAADAAAFFAAIAIGAVAMASTWDQHGTALAIVDLALGVAACVSLWQRRAQPLRVALFAVPVSALSASATGAALASLFTVAVHCRARPVLLVGALSVLAAIVSAGLYAKNGFDFGGLAFGVMFTAIAIGWGSFVRARRQLVLSLHERAHRLEADQHTHVEQARQAERTRIAREMHDVLAHRLSLLSVQAGALEFRPDAPADEVARATGVIRASAHTALEELREVIGLLRDGRDGAPEQPQPTLAHVQTLVDESRQSGMEVRSAIALDDDGSVPDSLGRTAYRVVQEGLTNARKHAPGSVVDVRVARQPDGALAVEVTSGPPHDAPSPRPVELPSSGTGLIGLSERVKLAGGSLQHGRTAAGHYVLKATLPWPR
jgi:signal transduction histidine kinase